jgi:ribosomal protein L11 methyltransferase
VAVASEEHAASARLQRLTISVARDLADVLRGELAELVPHGWREHDPAAGEVAVDVWVPTADAAAAIRLAHDLDRRGVAARVTSVPEGDDWRDGLRRHHQPIEVGGRLRVRPPWTEPRDGLIDIVIDPGMAFGTGQHATTRGCLALLLDGERGSVLDVGCGSGVLAIAARKLGNEPVWAIDDDPLAVEATIRNAHVNGVDLRVFERSAERDRLPRVDTVVANITATHVVGLAAALESPYPRRVVLSGFRPAEAAGVVDAWSAAGFLPGRRIDDDGWTALAMQSRRG